MTQNPDSCRICEKPTVFLGIKKGYLDQRDYFLRRCPQCCFTFTQNYRTDFSSLYDEAYYRGLGADPVVHYLCENEHPNNTIRIYLWDALISAFKTLCPQGKRWLDYGSGLGGLVAYGRSRGIEVWGHETEGYALDKSLSFGIPMMTEKDLTREKYSFDFISALEVLEHVPYPLEVFQTVRSLLKPGGIFFYTTGNAEPWRDRFFSWGYTRPSDVHISFFEPTTIAICLEKTGFSAKNHIDFQYFWPIIQYNILKCFYLRKKKFWMDYLPWTLIARHVNKRYRITDFPYGIAL